ncbi:MAG: metalloregulator ArsR/SmtB family transcription factor [Gammaproteobacteria bacterium]|nr:metalloregulator ArsR/SmtB family transcription factor [Gammaproteobacteria bacterium]
MNAVQFFKCLSDETRLNSTLLIHQEGETCVCELMEALGDSQPKISRHLSQLRSWGILTDRRQEQWVFYSIHPNLPDWALTILNTVGQAHKKELLSLKKKLKAMKDRPNRC